MIITKTPYRISFFGGGSDYPEWYKKNGGAVLSSTINKYIYLSCRFLPSFFKHKYRIVWSKIENVKSIKEIDHKAVREILRYLNIKHGLEIHYDGDLPARSGMGSSSCFVVGLLKALNKIKENPDISKEKLSKKSIFIEQKILNEVVGSQDQVAASYGGFNKIIFNKNGSIKVNNLRALKNIKKLNNNLLLIYTGIQRTAHTIADGYVKKLSNIKKNNILKMLDHVKIAENILSSGDIDDFGILLNEAWLQKKELSNQITNKKIDELYNHAIENGALGGKLLGAGGGGFLLLYMKDKQRKNFLNNSKNIVNVPFSFTNDGCQIIFDQLKKGKNGLKS